MKRLREKEKMLVLAFFPFLTMFSACSTLSEKTNLVSFRLKDFADDYFQRVCRQLFPKSLQTTISKEFADDYFRFEENNRKLAEWVENTVEKGEIARYEQFLLFPQCFQKTSFVDT